MHQTPQTLAERIVYLRKIKGFSQERLAEESGISLRTIQRIEKDTSQPRGHTLNAIAQALGCNPEDLQTLQIPKSSFDTPSEQDLRKLNQVNIASFAILFLPFGNLIAPAILYSRLEADYPLKKTARRVLSFQLIWCACIAIFLLILPYLNYTLNNLFHLKLPLIIIGIAGLIAHNLYHTIQNSIKINQGDVNIYPRVPQVF